MSAARLHDVVICGAGPAGSALALLLAERANDLSSIVILDKRALAVEQDGNDDDARVIAVSEGSRATLARIGAWDANSATPIERIHVSQRGHFGRTVIDRADYGVNALGYAIPYRALTRQFDLARGKRAITALRPAEVLQCQQCADHVELVLDTGQTLLTRYVVHAEGGLFGQQQKQALHRDYQQTAVTALVRAERPQVRVAWERFTDEGPLALLPIAQASGPAYALVWCGNPARATERLAASDADFLDQLHAAFGDRLGRFTATGPRSAFKLGLNASRELVRGREFVIGNAAQTLHPVAGQGLNLALRDACMLAQALAAHGDDVNACANAYRRARRMDRAATIGLTDLLPRLFSSRLFPLVAARGVALALLDVVSPLRHALARHMMDGQR